MSSGSRVVDNAEDRADMVQAKTDGAKQTNWGEKQVVLTWSPGHTLAYETTYIINIYCIVVNDNERHSYSVSWRLFN